MDLSPEELALILKALNKIIWSRHHIGIPSDDPRCAPFIELRRRVKIEITEKM